jgi:hypothetical protein
MTTARLAPASLASRAVGAALSLLMSVGAVATVSQALHVDRLGAPMVLVQLERVTVVGERPAALAASTARRIY